MTIVLPKHLEDWAVAEVKAGRARSVEAVAEQALESHRRQVEVLIPRLRIGLTSRTGIFGSSPRRISSSSGFKG
jgi:hypothetical protein